MPISPTVRPLTATAVASVVSILALGYSTVPAATSAATGSRTATAVLGTPQNGEMGFVVSHMTFAMGPDANPISCPDGINSRANRGAPSRAAVPGGAAAPQGPSAGAAAQGRGGQGGRSAVNVCLSPELAPPEPLFRTVVGSTMKSDGLDLDGQFSHIGGPVAWGTCAHDDFKGTAGEQGIDNQFYRAVGCSPGFQSTGGAVQFEIEMLTGSWGILISLKRVDSLVNDREVEVGIYANRDPIQLSAGRTALTYASYTPVSDPRFLARTKGRIVNGVLMTNPVDVRFHWVVNSMQLERPIGQARLRMTFQSDGSMDGLLGGYTDADELYDFIIGFRNGKDEKGNLSPARGGSAGGAAGAHGITCNGIYHALKSMADGRPDPKTGKCTALSHQYRIKAVPAFVVSDPFRRAGKAEGMRGRRRLISLEDASPHPSATSDAGGAA